MPVAVRLCSCKVVLAIEALKFSFAGKGFNAYRLREGFFFFYWLRVGHRLLDGAWLVHRMCFVLGFPSGGRPI